MVILQKNFLLILSLILLTLSLILGIAVIEGPSVSSDYNQFPANSTGPGTPTHRPSGYGIVDIINGTVIWSSDRGTSSPNNISMITFNQTSNDFPDYREAVIVYFKEMPESMKEFASTYEITPIFVKDEIKMAAFEFKPQMIGKTSENMTTVIEKISKDPLVELAKRDTYMFVNREREINSTPEVRYPEYYTQMGVDYMPDQVMVGFWRLPSSLEEFGAKYGGKPINVTQAGLSIQMVTYETENMKGFIDRASKDPYVRYIVLNAILKNIADATPEG